MTRMTWEALAFTAVLCAIAWIAAMYEARLEHKYYAERGKVCARCGEELAEPGKKHCAKCAKIERAKELTGD